MLPKPPRCPDCSSNQARPFVVPQSGEQRRYRADRRDAVLAAGAKTGQYPAWECPDCGQCFGDAKKPQAKLPVRTQGEWTALIRTMLPQPVTSNEAGDLLGGEPAVVIVRVTADEIVVMEAGWEWGGHVPTRKGQMFAKTSLRAPTTRVAELITMATSKRLSRYQWCPRCHMKHQPEHVHGAVCQGCAEKVLGIVF
jgi:hypothetical protein